MSDRSNRDAPCLEFECRERLTRFPPSITRLSIEIANSSPWKLTRMKFPRGVSQAFMTFRTMEHNLDIELTLRKHTFTRNEGYDMSADVKCDLILHKLYACKDPALPRAPRGLARAVLCAAVHNAIHDGICNHQSFLVAEVDPSLKSKLQLMYASMGFVLLGRASVSPWPGQEEEEGCLMGTAVNAILNWCCCSEDCLGHDGTAEAGSAQTSVVVENHVLQDSPEQSLTHTQNAVQS